MGMNKKERTMAMTLSRRDFLKVGGVTIAGTALLGACAQDDLAKPNLLVIMTDDMSRWMLNFMSTVQERMIVDGMEFKQFYAAVPLCSPDRASFLTGQYPHNHQLLTNIAAARTFHESGLDKNTLATDLRSGASYKTALIGKYLNAYNAFSEGDYVPAGWDHWVGLANADNPTIIANIDGTWSDTGVSTTEEIRWLSDHADSFIRANENGPWFCLLSVRAPHGPYTPSADSAHYADDIPLRRSESFDEPDADGMSDKPLGLRWRDALTAEKIAEIEAIQEGALEELQDVDKEVGRLLDIISSTNQAERTYVFFTSDNGFLLGEHRIVDKNLAYQEASILPLVVRGPGVASGSKCDALTSMVDLRATLTNLAGVAGSYAYDGRALTPLLSNNGLAPGAWRKRLLFEAPGFKETLGWHALHDARYVYVEWTNGEKELYDMVADPSQLDSIHESRSDLVSQYSAQLAALKSAKGAALRRAERTV
jgi:N-acetylglucosamine-6-sulfatase